MSGPIAATGAISNPTRYGALQMSGEQFTGMWTQAGPYRDAATAYLVRKFYQGSRFDRMIDGLNREITSDLTDGRRPGSAVYNSNVIPPVNSYFSWKYIQDNRERVRVLGDHRDGTIRDITVGNNSVLMTKSAGAGRARFMNLGAELFIGDGVDQSKILDGSITWPATTNVPPGTLISTGSPGTMQMALGGITMDVVSTSSNGVSLVTVWIDPTAIPAQFANLQNINVTFSGLTTATFLNGHTYAVGIASVTLGILVIGLVHAPYAQTADFGSATTGTGVTGSVAPAFSTTRFLSAADGGQQWKCYGPALANWGVAAPPKAPTVTAQNGTRFWQPNAGLNLFYAVLDGSLNVQVLSGGTPVGGLYLTGRSYPTWSLVTATNANPETNDGNAIWTNLGKIGNWKAITTYASLAVILDSNSNWQYVSAGGGGASGGSAPASWATATGATTADGALTWTCLGPGVILTTATVQYAFGLHGIDGTVSTASPTVVIQGPIVGPKSTSVYMSFQSLWTGDTQLDQVWMYRTAQGQSTLIFEDAVPIDNFPTGGQFFNEQGITDTSTNGTGALNAFIQAAVAHQNDPPPAGLTGPVYHMGRTWGFVGNAVYYSAGPNTIPNASNGNTAWPPLNRIAYQAVVVRILPITVQNGALLVFTTSGIFIILGTGTATNPFYSTQYCSKINLGGYDVLDVFGTEIFLMEANFKVSSLQVEYPFNPQSGYTEVGFPIGDQFKLVTTGAPGSGFVLPIRFTPSSSYLSWNVQGSGETAMYLADNSGHWFRMSMVSPPETGLMWNPIAKIAFGGSAIQSVETAPGVFDLLIGPAITTNGPILKRDTTDTIWDDNGTAYPAWDVKGVNLLCSTGQWSEVAHISSKSKAVGARPVVSVLMGEIAPSPERPWDVLEVTGPDPANTRRSVSVFSDRYDLLQNGVETTGDCILTKFDYGTQAAGDELLDWGIFASTEEERKEEVQKA